MHFVTHENYVKFEFQFLRYSLIGTQPCSLTHVCSVVAYVVQKQSWDSCCRDFMAHKAQNIYFLFFFFFFNRKSLLTQAL